MPIRVLVAEDFEDFRRFVCAGLRKRPDLQVVCEVADGLEAVEKAQELSPDLILLDIGLPSLNGIEAARRILGNLPGTRILFITQECSTEVVEEALRAGGRGYVVKADTGRELPIAVETVLRGGLFVGGRFAGRILMNGSGFASPK